MGITQSCKQMQPFSAFLSDTPLVPNVWVQGTDNCIVTGVVFAIKSAKHNAYLHPGGISGLKDRCFVQPGIDIPYQYWIIQDQGNSQYAIRNVKHKSYLHPGGIGGLNDRAFVQPGIDRPYQLWQFENKETWHTKTAINDRCFVQPGIDGLYQQWYFEPQEYKISVKLRDFTYPENIDSVLQANTHVSFIDKNIVKFDEASIGSSASRTFTKAITNTYSWSLNEKFSVSIAVSCNAGIPLLGGASTTITASAQLGSSQQWSKTEQVTVSTSATMCPKTAGTYSFSGWVDIAQDLQLDFTAIAEIRVTGQRQDPNGNIVGNSQMDDSAIEYYLRYACPNFQPGNITARNSETIFMKVSGKLQGSYGLRTYTTFEKISDN